ncbi:RDD family protein [Aurantiacibacter sp. MUD61]|uniref:RDD family protein n=1 Tax=Aurantiacibacter sp. MUD61 TaxID=3009083 RepID=UPI0022F083D9|nr:RDD family protein [Aurantiacibacter sp. MUD61]
MSAAMNFMRGEPDKRDRMLVTPEGLALPLTVGSRGARAGALMLDMIFIVLGIIAFFIIMGLLGFSLIDIGESGEAGPVFEFLIILVILFLFLARYGYFLWFELGPRGATPGKRLLGLRVAARDGGQLTAEMVIARNLVRDVEVFLPLFFLLGGGEDAGVAGFAAFIWLAIFVLFPFCNKDALRAGDVVAGTWVVEAKAAKLKEAMSLAPDRSHDYRFGEAELSVYGEHELQVLETVLRQDQPEALRDVAEAITGKIGWRLGQGDEREFLEAFYAALRGHLEGGMRFGKRKRDKFS